MDGGKSSRANYNKGVEMNKERLIDFAMLAIVLGIAYLVIPNTLMSNPNLLTRQTCAAGFVHVVSNDGSMRQVKDENGRGIPCGK